MSPARRRLAAAAALAALAAGAASCLFGVDPDKDRFSCVEQADCGPGFECWPQAAGGALCFRAGECSAETCDEQDNNCDGRADEGFDLSTDPANCGACGNACLEGAGCLQGHCRERTCADGQDNDEDGLPDCADKDCPLGGACAEDAGLNCGQLVPDAGGADAGEPDAGEPPDAGSLQRACVPREADCANGLDDDLDDRADCADPDCEAQSCGSGQKICSAGECR